MRYTLAPKAIPNPDTYQLEIQLTIHFPIEVLQDERIRGLIRTNISEEDDLALRLFEIIRAKGLT